MPAMEQVSIGNGVVRGKSRLRESYTTSTRRRFESKYCHLKSDLKSPPRYAVLRTLWWGKVKLDQALIIYFAKESSFTGEETVEIHLHGSKAIIDMTFNALNSFENIRPAGPGDFTLQALKNGKLNLSQVEGLAN